MYSGIHRSDQTPAPPGFIGAPILAVCCCLLVLFLLACTVVIALIPVYLPVKDATAARCSLLYFSITSDSDFGFDGSLDDESIQSIAQAISMAAFGEPNSIDLDSANIISYATRRRRRHNLRRFIRQSSSNRAQKIIAVGSVNRRKSVKCRSLPSRLTITTEITIRGDSRTATLVIEISNDSSIFTTPSTTTSSTTSTTASSTTSTTTSPSTTNMLG